MCTNIYSFIEVEVGRKVIKFQFCFCVLFSWWLSNYKQKTENKFSFVDYSHSSKFANSAEISVLFIIVNFSVWIFSFNSIWLNLVVPTQSSPPRRAGLDIFGPASFFLIRKSPFPITIDLWYALSGFFFFFLFFFFIRCRSIESCTSSSESEDSFSGMKSGSELVFSCACRSPTFSVPVIRSTVRSIIVDGESRGFSACVTSLIRNFFLLYACFISERCLPPPSWRNSILGARNWYFRSSTSNLPSRWPCLLLVRLLLHRDFLLTTFNSLE